MNSNALDGIDAIIIIRFKTLDMRTSQYIKWDFCICVCCVVRFVFLFRLNWFECITSELSWMIITFFFYSFFLLGHVSLKIRWRQNEYNIRSAVSFGAVRMSAENKDCITSILRELLGNRETEHLWHQHLVVFQCQFCRWLYEINLVLMNSLHKLKSCLCHPKYNL